MASIFSGGRASLFSRSRLPAFTACLAALLVLALAGCHQVVTDPHDPHFIVAEGKGWHITRGDLNDMITTSLKSGNKTIQDIDPAKMPQLETNVLRFMVVKKLLLKKAATLHLKDVDKDEAVLLERLKGRAPSEADFDAQLKAAGITLSQLKTQLRERILMQKTVEAEAFQNVEPTDAEIDAFYLKYRDKFDIPEKIRASRVVVLVDEKTTVKEKAEKKKIIDAAHARVMKGEEFSKVASEVSEDRYSAPKGGDIGYFQKGENEPAFDAVAFAMKPGVLSPVFETPMGYQCLKVTDVHRGGSASVAEARDIIANRLREEKQDEQGRAYVDKLLATSGVTFHLVLVNPAQAPGTNPPSAPDTNAAPE
jgi:parvulin-like peptidyl-prolyl isomerase